jgi:hypothetical protein
MYGIVEMEWRKSRAIDYHGDCKLPDISSSFGASHDIRFSQVKVFTINRPVFIISSSREMESF